MYVRFPAKKALPIAEEQLKVPVRKRSVRRSAIRQFDIWLAELGPSLGTEPGKTRPVIILQSDLLNGSHPSTVVCPATTLVKKHIGLLRLHLNRNQIRKLSDVLIDQIRAIDNRRLIRKVGHLNPEQKMKLRKNLLIVFDL
jgi:mRNA interferase MazF